MADQGFPLHQYIKSGIDRIWQYWPPANEAKRLAYKGKNKKKQDQWECAHCKKVYIKVFKDHIEPVDDPYKGFQGWDIYVKRKFIPTAGIQILCKECHQVKSNKENKIRRNREKK